MQANALMSSSVTPDNTPDMLYCMQLRCGDRRLIVPRNSVVEIKAFAQPEPLLNPSSRQPIKAPEWLLGAIPHHDRQIPLLSLTQLIDSQKSGYERARICIMQALGEALQPAIYAVVCQGFPTLLEVPATLGNALAQQKAPADPDQDNDFIASQIQLGGYYCGIPDLLQIESILSQTLTEVATKFSQ